MSKKLRVIGKFIISNLIFFSLSSCENVVKPNITVTPTPKISASMIPVPVPAREPLKIISYPENIIIRTYEKIKIYSFLKYSDNTLENKMEYSSSNPLKVQVDNDGIITGISGGRAEIIIKNGNKVSKIIVLVKDAFEPFKESFFSTYYFSTPGKYFLESDSEGYTSVISFCSSECVTFKKRFDKNGFSYESYVKIDSLSMPPELKEVLAEPEKLRKEAEAKIKPLTYPYYSIYHIKQEKNQKGDYALVKQVYENKAENIHQIAYLTLQIYDSTKKTLGKELKVNSEDFVVPDNYYYGSFPFTVKIIVNKNGDIALLWYQGDSFFLKVYDINGNVIAPEQNILKYPSLYSYSYPPFSFKMSNNGKIVVLIGDSAFYGITGILTDIKTKITEIVKIKNTHNYSDLLYPIYSVNNKGDFVILWKARPYGTDNIFIQEFDSKGVPKCKLYTLSTSDTSFLEIGDIILNDDSSYVIFWDSRIYDNKIFNLYSRFFNPKENFPQDTIFLNEGEKIDLKNDSRFKTYFGNDDVILVSSDTFIAKQTDNFITGVNDGVAVITAFSKNNPEKKADFKIKVSKLCN